MWLTKENSTLPKKNVKNEKFKKLERKKKVPSAFLYDRDLQRANSRSCLMY